MSRHEFTTPEGATWTVGFDAVVASYYAQTEIPGPDRDLVDITGTAVGEVPTVAALQQRLVDLVAIPSDIIAQLSAEGPAHERWLRPDLAHERIDSMNRTIDNITEQ